MCFVSYKKFTGPLKTMYGTTMQNLICIETLIVFHHDTSANTSSHITRRQLNLTNYSKIKFKYSLYHPKEHIDDICTYDMSSSIH